MAMSRIVKVKAWCNNEVGYLAWRTDGIIKDCLGFMITRIHFDLAGNEVARRVLPAWVAFDTQSNPKGEEQDTSVWPIQKFSWRDLTLRRSRNETVLREGEFKVRYEVVPVGLAGPGRSPVPLSATAPFLDDAGKPRYKGDPIPLFFCGEPVLTDELLVTGRFGKATVAFNNGILSTQNLRKQLETPDGKTPSKSEVLRRIADRRDPLRWFLGGDALKTVKGFFDLAEKLDADIYLALYELHDEELIDLIDIHHARIHLILSTAGKSEDGKTWDTTNEAARARLRAKLGDRLQNRMFNNSKHIGHNKFGVLVSRTGEPITVLTGSTNWTSTGLCGQTNNAVMIEDMKLAEIYLGYWQRLLADVIPEPAPLSKPNNVDQGPQLRADGATPHPLDIASVAPSAKAAAWFSPNMSKVSVPRQNPATPPDMQEVFDLMRGAKQALLFLSFYPAQQGRNSIIGEAVKIAAEKPDLLVLGAISAPQAMPNYEIPIREDDADEEDGATKAPAPSIYQLKGAPRVMMVRASAIRDLIGDFQRELLTAGTAIIHDKIVVIDPLSQTDCVVITGSHNLGFKASYANDENMLIIKGAPQLAAAYAVHVLDVQDHYRYRAVLEEQRKKALLTGATPPKASTGHGFLHTDDGWQEPYFDGRKGDELRYFAR